ncbi:MAG TPA: ribonuclease J, partial [Candidatus Paceibacterota bacterium]
PAIRLFFLLRVDNNNGVPTQEEEESYGRLGKEKNLVLLADSTNAENPGFSLSERLVLENIEQVIRDAKGRLIIGTFASQLQRIMEILKILEGLGKKVIIEGRSMKSNIEIVQKMNMIKLQPGTIIPVDEVDNYPDSRIVVIATGSQGEEFAAIMRMSNKTHKYFRVKKGDTVLLSSSIIPGNEMGVQKIKDNLSRQGAKIVSYRISQIHASGHANKDELAWIHRKIGAKFFIPIHGYHYMLSTHADIAKSTGTLEENVVIPDNGLVIEIKDKGEKIFALKERAPASPVMVDGFSVGDVQDVVIRDRQMLAQDGMFVVIATVDSNTGRLKKSPDLISRGFVYLKENQELLQQSRLIIKRTVETGAQGQKPIDFDYIKANLTDQVAKFLFQKTAKRPLVIPVILSV